MARLKASIKTETAGRPQAITHRLGEQFAEAWVSSRGPGQHGEEAMTTAKVRMHEDGSGTFHFRRGNENITIRWTEEPNDIFELYADFNGVEGVLRRTDEPVEVPEGANDN